MRSIASLVALSFLIGCSESDSATTMDAASSGPDASLDLSSPGPADAAPTDAPPRPDAGPPPCSAEDVVLTVDPEPVLRMRDIPFSASQLGPFFEATWLPGGYFVVSGDLNNNVGVRRAFGVSGTWLGAGQYVFSGDGEHLGTQDIAYDARRRVPSSCGEGVYWQAEDVEWIGPDTFIRIPGGEANQGQVFELAPLKYRVEDGRVTHIDTLDATPTGTNDCQLVQAFQHGAATWDHLVVNVEEDSRPVRTHLYDVEAFTLVGTSFTADCMGRDTPAITPLRGVGGDRILARTHEWVDTHPATGATPIGGCMDVGDIDLYRVDGDRLVHIDTVLDVAPLFAEGSQTFLVQDTTLDASDPDRFALAFLAGGGAEIRTFRRAGAEVVLEEMLSLEGASVREIALAGNRLAYRAGLTLHLRIDGMEIEVPEPPLDDFWENTDRINSVELSDQDTMLVGQPSQVSIYRFACAR